MRRNNGLLESLKDYCDNNSYVPMHMPGHKRNTEKFHMKNPYAYDITEIDGFDNLHNPNGVIRDLMNEIKSLYGSDNSYLLTNGSSCGILAAISSVSKRRGKIVIARNSHISVYNAIYLNELTPVYVYPSKINDLGISSKILPLDVEKILRDEADISAVVITSPTYEGVVSDISSIAQIVHEYNIPLIVDEAHGAHFRYHSVFPESALDCGADIVIQSIHKTLPAFTQTALLHIKGKFVDNNKIKQYLDIYQTTSPSYILMAGIEQCIHYLKKDGDKDFDCYVKNLMFLRKEIKLLDRICLLETDDKSKIVLYVKNNSIDGKQLYDILRIQYHIQLEMSSLSYVIAMTSVGDKREYYDRFLLALKDIDEELKKDQINVTDKYFKFTNPAEVVMTPYEAVNHSWEEIKIENSVNRISSSTVCVYPPGCPIINAGEIITEEIVKYIKKVDEEGLQITGLRDLQKDKEKELVITCLK